MICKENKNSDIEILENGSIVLDEKVIKPAKVEILDDHHCYLTIEEGRYHQVKRMMSAVGNEVLYLKRISMGPLQLDENLQIGEWRWLSDEEVQALKTNR